MFRIFSRWSSPLYSFEKRIVAEVSAHLSPPAAGMLRRQLEAVNKVQRLSNGKEVNLYQIRGGQAAFDDSLRFPDTSDEALLATVAVRPSQNRASLNCEVWLAKGRLFSLVFDQPPGEIFGPRNLQSVEVDIIQTTVWRNPMNPPPTRRSIEPGQLWGWVKNWYDDGVVSDMRAPLSETERSSILARINTRLPFEYLELVAQSEGATIANVIVHGLSDIRKVTTPDANYVILMEDETVSGLAIREGDSDGTLFFFDSHSDPRPAGVSFVGALSAFLRQRHDRVR